MFSPCCDCFLLKEGGRKQTVNFKPEAGLGYVKAVFMRILKTFHDDNGQDGDKCVFTTAVPIFLPRRHLSVLFGSREEGNSLAEAEAALSARVLLHFGALQTVSVSKDLQCVCNETIPTTEA